MVTNNFVAGKFSRPRLGFALANAICLWPAHVAKNQEAVPVFSLMCPREESNLDSRLRSPEFYPLNYKGLCTARAPCTIPLHAYGD